MFELMNEMLELIYVADIDTYDLLFMNTIGCETFHIDKVDGLKCYKVLQGLDSPCPFCTNALLTFEKTYNWSFTNPVTNCHYLLKDKLINWEGKTARIEIAFDDTESEHEKISLKAALEGEKMMIECAKLLNHTTDITTTINEVLKLTGVFLNAARAYVFDICGNKMHNTYEWCAKGIQPQIDTLQNLDISLIDTWMPSFQKLECFILESIEDMKEQDENCYNILKPQGIKNFVVAPLEKEGQVIGYIGVDNPPKTVTANIAPLFHTLSYFLVDAMRRVEGEEKLAQLSYHDMLTGFYNRNRFIQDTSHICTLPESIGVVYMDINGLKDINDCYGHSHGDQIIFKCAQKIADVFDVGDFYRIGGDEFVIICKAITESQFATLVTHVKDAFSADAECHIALGYQWAPRATAIKTLIAKADTLMYKDKERYYLEHPHTGRYRHAD